MARNDWQLTCDEQMLTGLREQRRIPISDGGARLLRDLVSRGLPEHALLPAAGLVGVLEESAIRRNGSVGVPR